MSDKFNRYIHIYRQEEGEILHQVHEEVRINVREERGTLLSTGGAVIDTGALGLLVKYLVHV